MVIFILNIVMRFSCEARRLPVVHFIELDAKNLNLDGLNNIDCEVIPTSVATEYFSGVFKITIYEMCLVKSWIASDEMFLVAMRTPNLNIFHTSLLLNNYLPKQQKFVPHAGQYFSPQSVELGFAATSQQSPDSRNFFTVS